MHCKQLRISAPGKVRAGRGGGIAGDKRILAWDLWNEPATRYKKLGTTRAAEQNRPGCRLIAQVFAWARDANPTQPLTSGVWHDAAEEDFSPVASIQTGESDFITFTITTGLRASKRM